MPSTPVRGLTCLVLAASLLTPTELSSQEGAGNLVSGRSAKDHLVEAGRAFSAGDLAAAERSLLEVTRLDPKALVAWLGLAEIAERSGRSEEALEFARRAQVVAPTEPRVLALLGRILARSGATSAAVEVLGQAIEANPRDGSSYLLASLLLRDQGKGEAAIELLERARTTGIGDPALLHELGFLLLAAGEPERVGQLVEGDLAGDQSSSTLVLRGLAMADEPERRLAAVPILEEALRRGAPLEGRTRLELAAVLLELGRIDDALAHLEAARGLLDDDLEVTYRLAAALRAAGRSEEAARTLAEYQELRRRREAADSRARQLGAELNEAYKAAQEGRLEDAMSRLDAILAESPDHVATLALRAKTAFSGGDLASALEDIARCRAIEPGNAEFAYLEGLFLLTAERRPEAEAALRRALILSPDLAEAQQLMAVVAVEEGRWREAARWVEAARRGGAANATLDRLERQVAEHLEEADDG